ncbi:MAG TPA: hypothetical protein VGS41_10885 [Chthonomonadales bacterium]|nr:hypothetical protein [Chthonomonadales bacterium]
MRRSSQGYILVQVLIITACLISLMAMFAANQHAAMQDLGDKLRARRAEVAARSAVQVALATLEQANSNVVAQTDAWYQQGANGDDLYQMPDNCSYRMQIVDAGSMVNVNTATQAQLTQLPLTQAQIDCLLDWRETSLTPRGDGAKDQYYNGLVQPYNTRLGNLATLSELLLIKNWTGQTLYTNQTNMTSSITLPTDPNGVTLPLASMLTVDSGAPNTSASGAPLVNLSARNLNAGALARLRLPPGVVTQIIARGPFTSFARLLAVPGISTNMASTLLNGVTFTAGTRTTGKINLNTAGLSVLETVPGVTPSVATGIVSQQSSGFTSLGALATASGVSMGVLRSIADSFTVGSDTWMVRAYGDCNGTGAAIEAVVRLAGGKAEIQTWDTIHSAGVPAWWGWRAQPTQTVDMEVGQ